MRTSFAIVTLLGVLLALSTAADAQRVKRPVYQAAPQQPYSYERAVCEERAEAEDRTGQFAGYPCWAREAFGRGRSGGGNGR